MQIFRIQTVKKTEKQAVLRLLYVIMNSFDVTIKKFIEMY